MPSKLTFDTPVAAPAVDGLWIIRATDVREDSRSISLEIAVSSGSNEHPKKFSLVISNGACDCLVPNPSPTFQDVLIQEHRTSAEQPSLANAFDQVMGAYFMAGGTAGILQALVTLGLVPTGTVASS